MQCQDQKSQHKNKDKAFGVVRSRVYEQEIAKKQADDGTKRTSQVSSGDRSAKIRTYNDAQDRVTDHRVGLTLYDLENIMNGDIQKIVDELALVNNMEKLKENAGNIMIQDISGKVVFSSIVNKGKNEINTNLQSGVYIITQQSEGKKSNTKLIIK